MGQFAVDLVHELKRKDAKDKQTSRHPVTGTGNHRASPTEESRMTEFSGERDIADGEDDEEEDMQWHWNEKVNALLATAQSSILIGRRDVNGRDVSSQLERREFEGEEARERRSLHGTFSEAVGVQISVRIRDRNEGCIVAAVPGGCTYTKREEKKAGNVSNRGVEELLGDIEIVPSVPFPVTLFFDPVSRIRKISETDKHRIPPLERSKARPL